MKTTFLRFPTDDQLILQGLLYSPDTPTDKAILHIHGMAGNCYENKYLDSMARIFTDNGWAFFAINTRGHDYMADIPTTDGSYKRIGNAWEVFSESAYDIKGALDYLSSQGFTTLALQGHSLGAPKAIYYLSTSTDARVTRLVLASPADMIGLAEAESDFKQTMAIAHKMIREGRGKELLPQPIWAEDDLDGYPISANTYVDLSTRDKPVDIINTYHADKPSRLADITIPTFVFFGTEHEAVIMTPEAALALCKSKAHQCPRFDTAIFKGADHGYTNHEDEVATSIIDWLKG